MLTKSPCPLLQQLCQARPCGLVLAVVLIRPGHGTDIASLRQAAQGHLFDPKSRSDTNPIGSATLGWLADLEKRAADEMDHTAR